jgi:aryl-alcohol dehydrogenase-like predicted oxidoreductase
VVDVGVKSLSTYLDVLQIHRLHGDTPQEGIMKALNNVVENGKVHYIV